MAAKNNEQVIVNRLLEVREIDLEGVILNGFVSFSHR